MTTTPESHNTDRSDAPEQPNTEAAPTAAPVESAGPAEAGHPAPQYSPPEQPVTGHAAAGYPAPAGSPAAPEGATAPEAPAAPQHPVAPHGVAPQYAAAPQHPAAPRAGETQPTVALGADPLQPAGAHTPGAAFGPGHGESQPSQASGNAKPKTRTGALLAGLAIGALLGGVVGGGVAAVVASNVAPQAASQGSGAITLNNAENATAISGVAAVATPSVVTLEVQSGNASGSGSGVIYSEDGYIVTNAHVVTLDGAALENAGIRVKLSDGRILDGTLVGVDPYADLAVVKVDADGLPAIKVADSDKIDVGDLTVAIGAPLNLANTVTSGVVSALNRGISVGSPLIPQDPSQQPDDNGGSEENPGFPWDFRFGLPDSRQQQEQPQQQSSGGGSVTLPVIQTDASINPGNSGGALLNGSGELIGINVAIASASASSGTAGSNGLGFAIPANLASRVADAIIAGEQPSHGLLGASVANSSQDTDEDANHAGGLLVEVVRDGAAAKAGLKAGDVITAVDGVSAVDGTSVSALIRMHAGGSEVSIDYTRGGKPGQVDVKLGNLEW
ncbi:HtrA protease/chaperone protein [Leucobacter sp. 7(1)]|uniref:S1C family serine protease n=1 Tax=Leucobacter sp. 7(1) TaxID=1255613 RepID=UPI00097E9EA8|nr:trypsin-like peptidase domain-containing protein [Leucobacter sp. 7(1)]SJN08593.1 HtrA protease/chaperone protein [Leucobacter sp. 7(1)]